MPQQPNLNQMMKQVQQMQADMAKAQQELESEVVEASAGGGMVTVKVTGGLEVKEIRIDPEAIDPEDADMLQDLVLAAVNEALRSAQELAASRLGAVTGGLGGPGGLGGLGLPGL
ncbi:MAG: nucleoid-associated protein EbfC [Thermoleophilaceae bacterium]|jgi:DNA-binding YbaB/EbfC family protein|nr:nucleoid-associated protein EbfC [Thermoleophilaceae bacterium]